MFDSMINSGNTLLVSQAGETVRLAVFAMALGMIIGLFGSNGEAQSRDLAPTARGDAVVIGTAVKWPECYCSNRGTRVEIGELACLSVSGKTFLALCDMSLNNPAWRDTGKACPTT